MYTLRIFSLAAVGLWQLACSSPQSESRSDCAEIKIRYAQGFRLKKCSGGFSLQLANGDMHWLATSGDLPGRSSSKQHVSIPVRRVVCTGTTQLSWFTMLGIPDVVTGFPHTNRIFSPVLRDAVAKGRLRSVSNGGPLDEEIVFVMNPDVILADEGVNISGRLRERIPIIQTRDFTEPHPLGRAEWLRLAGILTGRMKEADSLFQVIEANYNRLAAASQSDYAPLALSGIPYGGIWYMPGTGSFMTRLIVDAGFQYPFPDLKGVTVPLGLEAVMAKGQDVDYWIGTGHWTSVGDAISADHRLNTISAVGLGNLFAYDARTTPAGGNDYFEEAVLRPDLLLQDLIHIRQKRLDRLRYYRKLPR